MGFRLLVMFLVVGLVVRATSAQETDASPGDIIVTEIMYAPDGPDSDREYIEVYNATDEPINLNGWTLLGQSPEAVESPRRDVIDEDLVVDGGEFVVLCENADAEENGGVTCAFDYVNDINHTNTADYVGLHDRNGEIVDRVAYDEEAGWPDATGASLEFVDGVNEENDRPAAWNKATARVGDFADQSGPNKGSPNANAPDGALPVELVGFRVRAREEGAQLRWSTASETGNAGFEIQRQPPFSAQWTREAFVPGHGTTTDARRYRHRVDHLQPGTHRFRLRQVDLDGTARIVAAGQVQIDARAGITLRGPNPVQGGSSVPVILRPSAETPVQVGLYDALGRRLRTIDPEGGDTDLIRVVLSTDGLAAGSYLVRVQGGGLDAVEKFTLVR